MLVLGLYENNSLLHMIGATGSRAPGQRRLSNHLLDICIPAQVGILKKGAADQLPDRERTP